MGLEADVEAAVLDALISWMDEGPPRERARILMGIEFYEAVIADRFLLGYTTDDARQRFAVLWLRRGPPGPTGV